MNCPYCRHEETKVVDTRQPEALIIRRRRECLKCERRFSTLETVEQTAMKVIKKDGTRVPYDREKIRHGLEKACWKRPVSEDQIDRVVAAVESDILDNFEREVPTRYIGEKVFSALREVDQVAFVRFASVYRSFQDVQDFVEELGPMLGNNEG